MAQSSLLAADVPCVILAGGLATRLKPDTERCPKSLVPVAGELFVAHQLRWLASEGIHNVILAIGYLGALVQEYVLDGRAFGVDVSYSSDGDRLLGTGGALRKAIVEHGLTGPVMVLYGDSYVSVDLDAVVERYAEAQLPALMVVYENRNIVDVGNAGFDGRTVRYQKGHDDPIAAGLNLIDYGVSVFEAALIIERVRPGVAVDLAEIQAAVSAEGKLAGYEASTRCYEIGSPGGLAELEEHLRQRGLTAK
jgi:NDP-sugar pyrophosphorylase family protein